MKQTILRVLKRYLPLSVRRSIFHVGFHIANDRFVEFAFLYANAPHMEHGLRKLKQRGFSPKSVLDIGAYHGEWSIMARRLWPSADIYMVEANYEKRDVLEKVSAQISAELHIAILGSKVGQYVDFSVMESGSSVYPEDSPLSRRVERRQTTTVDSILGTGSADLIKLDVQGFELEVLKGATASIGRCLAVILEVSLIEINKGAPLLHEVVNFMKERNFVVFEILGIHRRPLDGAMNQIDIMFVPEQSLLRSNTAHFNRRD